MSVERDDLDLAIATLGRALQGALEDLQASGVRELPRARFAKVTTASAPPPMTSNGPAALPPTAPVRAPPPAAEVPAPRAALPEGVESGSAAAKLHVLQHETIGNCSRCKLHRGRNSIVFGVGNPEADLVFVGEGPGADEDRQGVPFVGRAGQLLSKMIEAMNLSRDDVYICNVVKCRPPNNRDPEPDEVEACEPFLKAQLETLSPRVIVGLGRYAVQTLLQTRRPISRLRGGWHQYEGVDFMPTFHPSYLLRSPEKKREAWADLQKVMARLDELKSNAP